MADQPPHVHDLIPAYALGCLDDSELAHVEAHLAGCAECRAELAEYRQISDQLVLTSPLAEPALDLRDRLHARIAALQEPPETRPEGSLWERFSAFTRQLAPVWVPVSLVLILVLGGLAFALWRGLGAGQVTQPVTVAFGGTEHAPGALGVLTVSATGRVGTLVVSGLPQIDPSQQYQLWLIEDDQRTNGGVFSVDQGGFGTLEITAPAPLLGYSGFGITIEPAGGSPGPTGPKVLGAEL